MDRDRRFDEVRRCLSEADRAFARAAGVDSETERIRLMEEAEGWLREAERRLARLADRPMSVAHPHAVAPEERSFGAVASGQGPLAWPRTPKG